jgi:hypothetical protein
MAAPIPTLRSIGLVKGYPLVLCSVLLFGLAAAWPFVLVAQPVDETDGTVRVGDRWVYDTRDEMTGYPKETYVEVVTEVSPKETLVNLTVSGNSASAILTYDHDWNCIDNLIWKFKPNDGQGIRLPLAVGRTWRSEFEAKNTQTSANIKGSGSSKVVAQENITTSAGTFETFKIERRVTQFSTTDAARHTEIQVVTWYAPQINNVVRRKTVVKFEKRIRSSGSEELADFTRNL